MGVRVLRVGSRVQVLGAGLEVVQPRGGAAAAFVGAYDAIPNLVHVYEPARCTLSAYAGNNLIRLRRASDNAMADFSHVSPANPELDVAAIAAWAGGASYIVSIYDQVLGDTMTQAVAGNQPLFVANIRNGHAGGRYNGTSHCLAGPFTVGGQLSQPYTIYSLFALDATLVDAGIAAFLFDGNGLAGNRAWFNIATSRTPDLWRLCAGVSTLVGGVTNANYNILAALFNGAASQYWINSASIVIGDAGAQNLDSLIIGRAGMAESRYWKGDIGPIVIVDPSHSDAQRIVMQAAMNAYWACY